MVRLRMQTQHMSLGHNLLVLAILLTPTLAGVGKIPGKATLKDARYQPAMDFDTDSCYAVSAMDENGNANPGVWTSASDLTGDCRDAEDLKNSNAYSRQRCNNNWCVYVYDYYFEKDASGTGGHRHDWEHVVVWVKGDQSGNEPASDRYVATSYHGNYVLWKGTDILWHTGAEGKPTHPKVVYHKDGPSTHCFRKAETHDDPVENHSKQWFFGDLISHNGYPNTPLRNKLYEHKYDGTLMAVIDSVFANEITKARPRTLNCAVGTSCNPPQYKWDFTFDATSDDGSPGDPPAPPPVDPPTTPPPPPPVPSRKGKMMIVGDSITHGQEGDFTWRYRLWQWLGGNGHEITFVGPSSGTNGEPNPQSLKPRPPPFPGVADTVFEPTIGRYELTVDSSFASQRHAARWGRQAKQVRPLIKQWCADHQPDYLVVLLGFNDLGWWVSGPEGLMDDMGNIVQLCREAKPDVKILIGNVISRSFLRGRDDLPINTVLYNERLRSHIHNWFRYESNIAYVDVNAAYRCQPQSCTDAYDGLHPNAAGEYRIAEAFVKVLKSDFDFGGSTFSSPDSTPARWVFTPVGLSISAVPEGFQLKWDQINGGHPFPPRGYNIRSRIQGQTNWWSDGVVYPSGRESWQPWVLKGQTWEYQVQAKGDGSEVTDWTPIVSATANPQTLAGPTNINTSPSGNGGIQFNWTPVAGNINRYALYVWDKDEEGAFLNVVGSTGTGAYVGGLVPGHRYGTWIATWSNLATGPAGGLPAAGREVIVSRGPPAEAPTNLRVVNLDPTTVQLTWDTVAGAAGYAVYYRSHKENGIYALDRTSEIGSHGVGFLFPGTWNYQFCVTAYNGNLESAFSNCVIPPVWSSSRKRDLTSANLTEAATNRSLSASQRMFEDKGLRDFYNLVFHNVTAAPARTE